MTTNSIHEAILSFLENEDEIARAIVLRAIEIAQSKPLSPETLATELQRGMKAIIKESQL